LSLAVVLSTLEFNTLSDAAKHAIYNAMTLDSLSTSLSESTLTIKECLPLLSPDKESITQEANTVV